MGVTRDAVERMSWMFLSAGVHNENHEAYLIFHIVGVHQLLEATLNLKARAPASQRRPSSLEFHADSQALKLNWAEMPATSLISKTS